MATEHEDFKKMASEHKAFSTEYDKVVDLQAELQAELQALSDRIKEGVGIDTEKLKVIGEVLAEISKKVETLKADILKENADQE